MHSAINSAGLTDRQTEAIAFVYGIDVTHEVAAKQMGISRQAVTKMIDDAAEKMAEVYKRWEYGEVSVEYTNYEEAAA